MKRKFSGLKGSRLNRLQELLSFVDHLSPTITVDNKTTSVTAVQLETENNVIEAFEAHKLSAGMDSVRQSVERYSSDIHSIVLIIPITLFPNASNTYDITMYDGTVAQCTTHGFTTRLVCMPRRPVLRPANLIRAVDRNDFDSVVNAIKDGVNVNSRESRVMDSALALAMTLADSRILEYLLDVPGIDTEDMDADGDPVLHRVLHCMSVKGLTVFARRGAGIYAQDRRGRSILHIAMEFIHVTLCHIEVILKYAPILTLHTDRDGFLSTENLTLDAVYNAAVNRASELIRPTKEKMISQVTEAISCIVPIAALSGLILDYYTVSDHKEHD